MTEATTQITNVGTVFVTVSDQEKALEFYRDKLGFDTGTDIEYGEGERWVEVMPPGAQTTLALVPPREGQEDTVGAGNSVGLAADDIDAIHGELRDKGVDVDEEIMRMEPPVPPMFFFRDPDGNSFVVAERAES